MVIQIERLFGFVFPRNATTNDLLAIAYISVFPNALLYFVSKNIKRATISLLFNFASGSLLGALCCYLLPHIMVSQKEGTDRQVIVVGICLGGYLFYATDRCMKSYSGIPSNDESKKVSQDTNVPEKRYNLRPRKGDDKKGDDKKVVTMKNQNTVHEIRPSTYLIVLVDFIRNLTNGMALAASFYISPAAGLVTTIAVFFYKVSLEISDFIQAGSTKTGALRAQFIKMVGTCIGTFVGVALFQVAKHLEKSRGENSRGLFGTTVGWDDAIISVIIGKFIYIVTVGIVVEMPSTKSKERIQSIKEVLSLAFGLHLMILVSWNEGRQKYE